MELPADVLIHNELLGIKGSRGRLLGVREDGYYEVNLTFGERQHRVMLPVAATVIINAEPEVAPSEQIEVER